MKSLLLPVALLAAFTGTDAFTASNAVGPTGAGSGSGAISGYAVSDVAYELDGTAVAAVSFALAPPGARTTRIRVNPAGPWHPCTIAADVASCPTPNVDVTDLDRLDVVATG